MSTAAAVGETISADGVVMDQTAVAATPASQTPRLGAERSSRRDLIHGIVLVFPWAGLVWLWWNLLRHDPSAFGLAGRVVVVGVVVTFVVTLIWIAHNLAISRRKGPRRGLPLTELVYDHDWTGRPVRAVWDEIVASPVVIVVATADEKSFTADPAVGAGFRAACHVRTSASAPGHLAHGAAPAASSGRDDRAALLPHEAGDADLVSR